MSNEQVTLISPVGIITLAGFTEMIPSGKTLPCTISACFGNAEDNQKTIGITLAQEHGSGREVIAKVTVDDLPIQPKGTLRVFVTVTVTKTKQLQVKVTIPEANFEKEYGPFIVK
jgi:molecular chaperone DnaK (HSP70)